MWATENLSGRESNTVQKRRMRDFLKSGRTDRFPIALHAVEIGRDSFVGMCYMFGFLVGSFLFGILSDRFGRKWALMASVTFSSATTLAGAFITDYWGYLVVRFVSGVATKGLFMLAFMISVEISGDDYKKLGVIIQVRHILLSGRHSCIVLQAGGHDIVQLLADSSARNRK